MAVATLAAGLLVVARPLSEPVRAQTSAPEAILVGAGDIAGCGYNRDYQTGLVADNVVRNANAPVTVFTLGDNAYPDGTTTQFSDCYDPTWGGSHLGERTDISPRLVDPQIWDLTMPVVGNHEYQTPGATPYFNYFGARAGDPTKGYYSYDRGSWHIAVLNSNCSEVGGCGASSPQGQWLAADLASHPASCTIAAFHHPLFFSGGAATPGVKPFWDVLYSEGVDLILNGHAHYYERFAPQDPQGNKDLTYGMRELVVGTGGAAEVNPMSSPRLANSEIDSEISPGMTAYGVLKLDLYAGSYAWEFRPRAQDTFTDSGTGDCHAKPGSADTTPPTISSVAPADGAANVAVTANVEANFSEAMAPSTINNSTFTLTKQGTAVQATVGYDPTNNKATLVPSAPLEAATTYTSTVKGGLGGVTDAAGNPLGADRVWSFTTQPADTTPPETTIDSGPSGTVRSNKAKFSFHSSEPDSTFRCSLDSATFSSCASPKQYNGLAKGSHTFRVYATDTAGNPDATPASRTWTVQR